jgi:hypothetical protein
MTTQITIAIFYRFCSPILLFLLPQIGHWYLYNKGQMTLTSEPRLRGNALARLLPEQPVNQSTSWAPAEIAADIFIANCGLRAPQ